MSFFSIHPNKQTVKAGMPIKNNSTHAATSPEPIPPVKSISMSGMTVSHRFPSRNGMHKQRSPEPFGKHFPLPEHWTTGSQTTRGASDVAVPRRSGAVADTSGATRRAERSKSKAGRRGWSGPRIGSSEDMMGEIVMIPDFVVEMIAGL